MACLYGMHDEFKHPFSWLKTISAIHIRFLDGFIQFFFVIIQKIGSDIIIWTGDYNIEFMVKSNGAHFLKKHLNRAWY